MEKYLVKIEFRYYDVPETEGRSTSKNKIVTIGIYNTFEDACQNGNNLLEVLESKFKLHQFPDGSKALKKRFSINRGYFGSEKVFLTHLAYLKTPFEFYASIETLKFNPINEVIEDVISASKKYKSHELGVFA